MISLLVNVDIADAGWKKTFPKMRMKISGAAACALLSAKKPAAFRGRCLEINILLTDNRNVRKLNRLYRGKDSSTNVLSFPQFDMKKVRSADLALFPQDAALPLGDIVLARGTIVQECKEQKKEIENHTLHLIVHGVLHLMGYDHMRLKDAKTMEKLECDILEILGYPDPYHEDTGKTEAKPAARRGKR